MKKADYKDASLLVGKKVRMLKTSGKFKKGEIHEVTSVSKGNPDYFYLDGGNHVLAGSIEMATLSMEDMKAQEESISKEIKSLQEDKKILKMKMDFMKKNKLDEFDEDEFKAFSILKALQDAGSDLEKAKVIAKIVKG